jgi:NOL1/NOP2/fmu family ribosome biogenesis protein
MKISILDNAKKKKFIEGISNFGIKRIHQLLVRSGTERIRAYSGSLSTEELMDLWRILPIEGVGLYFGKELIDRHGVREVRLSIDGLHVLKEQINNDDIILSDEQEKQWFYGRNIELEGDNKEGFVAVKDNLGKDFIGMGKIGAGGKMLYNFLPKERRRKTSII